MHRGECILWLYVVLVMWLSANELLSLGHMPSFIPLLQIHRISNLLVSSHFYYYMLWKGTSPLQKLTNRERYNACFYNMWSSWKRCLMHAYQVSSPWVLLLASEEVNAWGHFRCSNNVVVMETMYYTWVPSFISVRATVNKLEEFLKKSAWDYFVVFEVVMETM